MSRLGYLIRGKREALELSQKRSGNICALSDSEIMRIENGTREKPSWENLCRIAQALDFSPLEILLSAGYITENDIHPAARIKGLEKLSEGEIRYLQMFVDFMILKKSSEDSMEGGRSYAI